MREKNGYTIRGWREIKAEDLKGKTGANLYYGGTPLLFLGRTSDGEGKEYTDEEWFADLIEMAWDAEEYRQETGEDVEIEIGLK